MSDKYIKKTFFHVKLKREKKGLRRENRGSKSRPGEEGQEKEAASVMTVCTPPKKELRGSERFRKGVLQRRRCRRRT